MVRYMDSADAAEYLGFASGSRGANAIRQMVHRREIPHHRIGTRLRFDIRELDRWMAQHRVPARRPQPSQD